jgi:predicted metal-dependent hydrolase
VVRKIPFVFEDVDFVWNPSNPEFSAFCNIVSFQAIGFERYICKAMREAEKLTNDPAMVKEIRSFNAQEMTHALAHRKHVAALIAKYPGLQAALDASIANFEELWKAAPLNYHLAYTANIEATFMPLFGTIIEHRDALFAGGDPRMSSLMLWHFCEEIEHRSSALKIYNHVVRNPWYRLYHLRGVFTHVGKNAARLVEAFKQHVPEAHGVKAGAGLARLPKPVRAKMSRGIFMSQMPWHNPVRAKMPDYYAEWRARYEAGEDIRTAYAT